MNARTKSISFLLCVFIASSTLVISSSAYDSSPPVLSDVSLSNFKLPEEGGTVTLSARVSSPSYGLEQNPLPVFSVEGNSKTWSCTSSPMRMTLVSGDDKNGAYKCEINFVAPLMPGSYKLKFFPLTDKAGNATSFIDPNVTLVIGNVIAVSPSPSAVASVKSVTELESQNAALAAKVTEFQKTMTNIQAELTKLQQLNLTLRNKLTKICAIKPKPKGC